MKSYIKPTITVLALKTNTILAGSSPGPVVVDPQIEGSRQLSVPSLEPTLGIENLLPSESTILDL